MKFLNIHYGDISTCAYRNLCYYIGSKAQCGCCFRNTAENNHIKKFCLKGET